MFSQIATAFKTSYAVQTNGHRGALGLDTKNAKTKTDTEKSSFKTSVTRKKSSFWSGVASWCKKHNRIRYIKANKN